MAKSIEETVEEIAKSQLDKIHVRYFRKTEPINTEIDTALNTAESKSGGKGGNYPDIKILLETASKRALPVIIEVKGTKGKLVKLSEDVEIDNKKKDGKPNYKTIQDFAVNGAIHYANAIIEGTVDDCLQVKNIKV